LVFQANLPLILHTQLQPRLTFAGPKPKRPAMSSVRSVKTD
jgi:hypothetical protein